MFTFIFGLETKGKTVAQIEEMIGTPASRKAASSVGD
jgi:hypothetical protein